MIKSFSFLLLFVVQLSAVAQILDLQKEWFQLESFFKAEALAKQNIRSIHILVKDKRDGRFIEDRGTFLHYEFDENGYLTQSYKSLALSGKMDTTWISFSYMDRGFLTQKNEKIGPFHFSYHYTYENQLPDQAIKIDERNGSKDTLYVRHFNSKKTDREIIIETLNDQRKPYKTEVKTYDGRGRLLKFRTDFSRGQNYLESNFSYEGERLVDIKEVAFYHKLETKAKKISYSDGHLEFVKVFQNKELIKKYGFTFKGNGLISDVVERNYKEKSIRIYTFLYRFEE